MAPRWRPRHSLASFAGLGWSGTTYGGARAAKDRADWWGARLLAKQDLNGRWAAGQSGDGGLYSPKWTSTTYTMLLLRDFGLPADNPQARNACKLLLDEGLQPDGGINYGVWAKWTKRSETCVTGMVLSILVVFRVRRPAARNHCRAPARAADARRRLELPARQRCDALLRSIRLLASLKGLRFYELHRGRKVRGGAGGTAPRGRVPPGAPAISLAPHR